MGAMQKERLRPLTIAERGELQTVVKASSERVDRVKRATALLAVPCCSCQRAMYAS